MQQFPDIKSLYQRKYIKPNNNPESFYIRDPQLIIIQKAQRFHQRIIAKPYPNKKINCIRIVKQQQQPQRYDNNEDQSYVPTTPLKRYSSTATNKPTLNINKKSTSPSFRPKNELIRQIMKVSQQQLTDLQSSIGGQRRLASLLNVFFQKRQEAVRIKRHQRNISDFKPMHNLYEKRNAKEQQDRIQQFRINRQYINIKPQRKAKQKQLAPWSVQDLQYT